jgi:Ca2+-binding RTX toxin-like protein
MDEVFQLYAGNDRLACGRGNDRAFGGSGHDTVSGQEGADHLRGESGRDRLAGGFGNDTLAGGTGGDFLVADAGNDSLSGGSDADTFQFAARNGADVILDFEDGIDRIRINDAAVDSLDDLNAEAVGAGGSHLRLSFHGTAVVVRDLDLADFGAADVILLHDVLTG